MPFRRRHRRAALVVVLAVTVGLCAPAAGSTRKKVGAGTIVSSVPIANAPAGTKGWRIVYRTTTASGKAATSSGTVYVPTAPAPTQTRFVVAWAHPTLGTGPSCTPSRQPDPSVAIPGFAQMMANGWVVTSTDYTGLGTSGVLPYLVGEGEAHDVIDSVRAARRLTGTDAGRTYAVWGHSQGGHASLFTSDTTKSYAPELRLVGVAAAAPAAELASLVQLQWQQYVAWVIGSEVITTWPHFYPDLTAAQVATPLAQQNAAALGAYCITSDTAELLQEFGADLLQPFFAVDPTTVPGWRSRLDANTPTHARGVPVFVGQGLLDTVVLPSTTAQLEQGWCAQRAAITVAWYPQADHFTVPAAAAPAAVTWIGRRFAGEPAGNTCTQAPPVTAATNPPPATGPVASPTTVRSPISEPVASSPRSAP